jgi:hypothetical protein
MRRNGVQPPQPRQGLISDISQTSGRCAVNGFPIHPMMWDVAADECQISDMSVSRKRFGRPPRIFFDADRPPGVSGGQLGFHSSTCFESGVLYLKGSVAGPQIVLNGGAVTVKATPLHGRLRAEH